jgi:hypothetical protein
MESVFFFTFDGEVPVGGEDFGVGPVAERPRVAVVGQRGVGCERGEERVPVGVVDGGHEPANDGVCGFLGSYGSFMVLWANGQRSPMPTWRMMPAPMKLSVAVVIHSLGVAGVQLTLSA